MIGIAMSIAKISRIAATAAMTLRAGNVPAAKAPSTALVPQVPTVRAGPISLRLNRPDPSFVTHLIAVAEQYPQTRTLRRAATADVQTAYRSMADQNEMTGTTGIRMRLTA
jgi:hypothetical protein